jgi:hypothetical protein
VKSAQFTRHAKAEEVAETMRVISLVDPDHLDNGHQYERTNQQEQR